MAIRVECENRNGKRRVDLSKVKKIAAAVLRSLKKNDAELNMIFVSNQKIRALNRVYFNIDTATDVIAFPCGDMPGRDKGKGGKGLRAFLGDIVISSDKAAQNAKEYAVTFMEEVALYVIHGTLHLLGYEDRTKKGRKAMRRKEDELLQKVRNFS